MKILLTFFLLGFAEYSYCQVTIQNAVLACSGKNLANSTLSLEYTFGETFTESFINSELITQGFQQPYRNKLIIQPPNVIGNVGLNLLNPDAVSLYPNPFTDVINIKNNFNEIMHVEVFDLLGRRVARESLSGMDQMIYLNYLASGSYKLTISIDNAPVYEETLIKITD